MVIMHNCFTVQTASIQKTRKDVQGAGPLMFEVRFMLHRPFTHALGERQEQAAMSGLGAQVMGSDIWTFIPPRPARS